MSGELADDTDGLGNTVACMGRGIGADTLTLTYNPSDGTICGAYNLEPAILLRKNIWLVTNVPLQPCFATAVVGTSITIVRKPTAGL